MGSDTDEDGRGKTLVCIGSATDPLLSELVGAGSDRFDVVVLDERDVFTELPFALRLRGGCSQITLRLSGGAVYGDDLAGVVLRPTRGALWHSDAEIEDRQFLHHEALAAWFAVFDALPCPVVNRFPLAWWWSEPMVEATMAASLAHALGLLSGQANGSVVIAGAAIVSVSDDAGDLVGVLTERSVSLERWQSINGAVLCGLDLSSDRLCVDLRPDITGLSTAQRTCVAAGLVGALR
jgi:hypothetical protein